MLPRFGEHPDLRLKKKTSGNAHDPLIDRKRGRDLKTKTSYKCQQGRHNDCAAMRCQCYCHVIDVQD